MHSLQYDGRHDGPFGLNVGTWKIISQSGIGGYVCEELIKRMIDVSCLQEVRWRGRVLGCWGRRCEEAVVVRKS